MTVMSRGEALQVRRALRSLQERTGWISEALKRHSARNWIDAAEMERLQEMLDEIESAYIGPAGQADEVLG